MYTFICKREETQREREMTTFVIILSRFHLFITKRDPGLYVYIRI